MRWSNETKDLAQALAKAQAQLELVQKDAKNPYYKSKYATLGAVMEACKVLAKNEISITQSVCMNPESPHLLITRLMHSSGQWVEGDYPIFALKSDSQGYGSAVTYARRYGIQTLVGIATDDDDGDASGKEEEKPSSSKPKNGNPLDIIMPEWTTYRGKRLSEIPRTDLEKNFQKLQDLLIGMEKNDVMFSKYEDLLKKIDSYLASLHFPNK